MTTTKGYTGSAERLAKLVDARNAAKAKFEVAEEKLMEFLKRVKLTEETHRAIVHHVAHTENRELNDEEFRIVYGVEDFWKREAMRRTS